jgi:hypothetical protein
MLKSFLNVVGKMKELIESFEYKINSRTAPNHFTREGGKLGFINTIMIMMNFNNKTQQIELDNYFDLCSKANYASTQAYSEARQKIKPEAIKELFDVSVLEVCGKPELASVMGYTVIAVDGSTIALDNTPGLKEYFGCSGPKSTSCTGRISIACDTTHGIILDAAICEYAKGERQLALGHVERILELNVKNPLFIFDRGYAGKKLLAKIDDSNGKYILRVRSRWMSRLVAQVKSGEWGEFAYNKKTYRVRVIKLVTPKGEDEVLFSNVTEFTEDDFMHVYKLRWPVETKYDVLKNKLMLENFTGKSVSSVKQDFWATLTLANLVALAKCESDDKIAKSDHSKQIMHKYQTNTNFLIGKLKDTLIIMLLCDDSAQQQRMFDAIIDRVARACKVQTSCKKSNPRKNPRQKKKFNYSTKSPL